METPNQQTTQGSLTAWAAIDDVRLELASELEQMAADLPRKERQQLRSVSQWFRGSSKIENAIKRPDVLAVCLPLISPDSSGQTMPSDVASAARRGVCLIGQYVSITRHLFKLLLYPILLLIAVGILGVGFCFFVAPLFEEMFVEFGIDLPGSTKAVLELTQWVRHWGAWILAWLVGLSAAMALAYWIINRSGRNRRPGNLNWIDQQWMSTRNAMACWAWHLSLLLEAGIGQVKAEQIAARSTGKSWFCNTIPESVNHSPTSEPEGEVSTLRESKFELLKNAVRISPSAAQIALLRQVAIYYWDRNRSWGDWWIHWVVSFMIWGLGFVVFFAMLALLMPLFAIITGLSGGMW